MQRQQPIADQHAWTSAPVALQKMANRCLAARNKTSKLVLLKPGSDEFSGDFLEVHTWIITYVFRTINTFVMNFFITIVI